MDAQPVILLSLVDNVYTLMIIDDDGWEFLEFNNVTEALLARKAWQEFLYDEHIKSE
jgi:hypothetical protein